MAKAEARVDVRSDFENYYIDDKDGNVARGNETAKPPITPASPKTKKPAARKRNAPTPKSTGSTSSQESPSKRKSDRIAAGVKRTAKAIESDEAASAESSPNKKRKTGVPAGALTENKVKPAPSQKQTGRSKPTKAQTNTGKKSGKRPADFDDPANTIQPRPAKRPKKIHGLTKAQIESDILMMSIGAASESDQDDAAEADDTSTPTPIPTAPPTKGKGKNKVEATKTSSPEFDGESDQEGSGDSSTGRPADATLDTPWKCSNRNCNTGQTWHERKTHGRKVVSDYFGHNKKATNLIDQDVWHYSCRKDYQREKYKVDRRCEKQESTLPMCEWKLKLIKKQLVRIQLWRPEAKFKVQLNSKAKNREDVYNKEFTKTKDEDKAELAATVLPTKNKKGEDKPLDDAYVFPIQKMKEFESGYAVSECSFDHLKKVLAWNLKEAKAGRIPCVAPMEFLINKQTATEQFTDPTTNYDLWTAHLDTVDNGEESNEEAAIKTDPDIAGPSGTQNTIPASDETQIAASDAGDATTQPVPEEGDVPDFVSYKADTPSVDKFPQSAGGYDSDDYDSEDYDSEDYDYDSDDYDYYINGGYDYSPEATAAARPDWGAFA